MVPITEYHTVFEPHFIWWFPGIGLLVALGSAFFAYLDHLDNRKGRAAFAAIIAAIAGLFVLGTGGVLLLTYLGDRRMLATEQALVVEGVVENFHPVPIGGHGTESFTVAGVPFGYSDAVVTGGFNRSSIYGGPIQQGRRVRIHYYAHQRGAPDPENVILKLEIAE